MQISKEKEYLFFKNGKPKKKYMYCYNAGKREMQSLYGKPIIQCHGLNCPFYGYKCGRSLLKMVSGIENEVI